MTPNAGGYWKARRLVADALRNGPRPAAEMANLLEQNGVGERLRKGVRRDLGIVSVAESAGPGRVRWWWTVSPETRRREARERLVDHLNELLAERDHELSGETRAYFRALADRLVREGLAERDDRGRDRACGVCEKVFTPQRRDAVYCSSACASRAAYRRAKAKKGAA